MRVSHLINSISLIQERCAYWRSSDAWRFRPPSQRVHGNCLNFVWVQMGNHGMTSAITPGSDDRVPLLSFQRQNIIWYLPLCESIAANIFDNTQLYFGGISRLNNQGVVPRILLALATSIYIRPYSLWLLEYFGKCLFALSHLKRCFTRMHLDCQGSRLYYHSR